MKVQFNAPREIDGVVYTVGTHEVPESLKSHWFFMACLANGVCSYAKATAQVSENKPSTLPHAPPKMRIEDAGKVKAGKAEQKAEKPAASTKKAPTKDAKPSEPKAPLTDEQKAKQAQALAKRRETLEKKKAAAAGATAAQ